MGTTASANGSNETRGPPPSFDGACEDLFRALGKVLRVAALFQTGFCELHGDYLKEIHDDFL